MNNLHLTAVWEFGEWPMIADKHHLPRCPLIVPTVLLNAPLPPPPPPLLGREVLLLGRIAVLLFLHSPVLLC